MPRPARRVVRIAPPGTVARPGRAVSMPVLMALPRRDSMKLPSASSASRASLLATWSAS